MSELNANEVKKKEILAFFKSKRIIEAYLLNDDVINNVHSFIFNPVGKENSKIYANIDAYIKATYYFLTKDYEKMKFYYLESVAKGNGRALFSLGYYYESVTKDYEMMKFYYLKSIESGGTVAMLNLGLYYEEIEKDYEKMKYYYLKSIDNGGGTDTMVNLGHYYFTIEKDYEKMKYYYQMAIDTGDTDAARRLKHFYIENIDNLTQDQLLDAIEFCIKHYSCFENFVDFFYKLINKKDFVVTQRFIDILLTLDTLEKSEKCEFEIPNIVKFWVKNIITQVDILECHYKFQPGEEGFKEAKNDYFSQLISKN